MDNLTAFSILVLCAAVWLLADKMAELQADVESLKDTQMVPVIMFTSGT
jgi:hypothetical protein